MTLRGLCTMPGMEAGVATQAQYLDATRSERRRRLLYWVVGVVILVAPFAITAAVMLSGGDGDARIAELAANETEFSAAQTWDSGVTDNGLRALTRSHPHLRSLTITQCPRVTDDGLAVIARFAALEVLTLQGGHGFTSTGLSQLAACRKLRELGLAGVTIDAEAVRGIAGMPALRELTASREKVTAEALEILRKAKPALQIELIG